MTDQAFTLVPVERLDRMERLIIDLAARLDGATVTPAPEWLTISQAAERLGVDRSTVHRWIEAGRLQAKGHRKQRRVLVKPFG